MVAVHGGEGAAHHFDAFGGVEVEGGGLALAVRVAGGDAVGDQLDAAHAESGAGTEAAHRYLQVLGVVLAILDDQAGDAGQCLRGIHAEVARLVGAHVDRIDREGQIETVGLDPATGDHDRIERDGALIGRCCVLRAGYAGEARQGARNAEAKQAGDGSGGRGAHGAGCGGHGRSPLRVLA